jgi:hypothetical protein
METHCVFFEVGTEFLKYYLDDIFASKDKTATLMLIFSSPPFKELCFISYSVCGTMWLVCDTIS